MFSISIQTEDGNDRPLEQQAEDFEQALGVGVDAWDRMTYVAELMDDLEDHAQFKPVQMTISTVLEE